jgi:hypothetical protein
MVRQALRKPARVDNQRAALSSVRFFGRAPTSRKRAEPLLKRPQGDKGRASTPHLLPRGIADDNVPHAVSTRSGGPTPSVGCGAARGGGPNTSGSGGPAHGRTPSDKLRPRTARRRRRQGRCGRIRDSAAPIGRQRPFKRVDCTQ